VVGFEWPSKVTLAKVTSAISDSKITVVSFSLCDG